MLPVHGVQELDTNLAIEQQQQRTLIFGPVQNHCHGSSMLIDILDRTKLQGPLASKPNHAYRPTVLWTFWTNPCRSLVNFTIRPLCLCFTFIPKMLS